MKTNWQTKNIENCIGKIIYTNKIQRKDFLESGIFPVISQEQDLINGYWNKKEDVFRISRPVIVFGDHTQILKYVDFDFVLGADGVKLLQPKEFLYPKYFYYFLQSINLRSLGYARHYRILKEKDISYPESISEQKRIVKILDEAFEKLKKVKENTKKNLQKSKELFESYLNDVFSKPGKDWEQKTLKEVCEKITDGSHNPPNGVLESDYMMLSSKNVFNDQINYDNPRFLLEKDFLLENKRTSIKPGNILLTIVGTIGRVCVVPSGHKPFALQRSVAVIKNNINVLDSRFLMYLLQSKLESIEKEAHGAAQKGIYLNQLKDIMISFPALKEQKQIVKKLDRLSEKTQKLESLCKQKLENIEELKKSILQKAFNGDL